MGDLTSRLKLRELHEHAKQLQTRIRFLRVPEEALALIRDVVTLAGSNAGAFVSKNYNPFTSYSQLRSTIEETPGWCAAPCWCLLRRDVYKQGGLGGGLQQPRYSHQSSDEAVRRACAVQLGTQGQLLKRARDKTKFGHN